MSMTSIINVSDDIAWASLIESYGEKELWSFHCLRRTFLLSLSPDHMAGVARINDISFKSISIILPTCCNAAILNDLGMLK